MNVDSKRACLETKVPGNDIYPSRLTINFVREQIGSMTTENHGTSINAIEVALHHPFSVCVTPNPRPHGSDFRILPKSNHGELTSNSKTKIYCPFMMYRFHLEFLE